MGILREKIEQRLAERQILVALAKVAELSEEIERSQQESARRRRDTAAIA